MKLQETINRFLFHPVGRILKNMKDSARQGILVFCVFSLVVLQMLFSSSLFPVRYLVLFIPSCFFLGIIILLGSKENMETVKFNKFAAVCWIAVTLSIGINGLFMNTDDLSEFVLWAAAFPLLFFAWGNNFNRLFSGVTKGVCLSFILYFLCCMLFFPIQGSGYAGIWSNPNVAAIYLTSVALCMLIELISSKKWWQIILYALGYGIAFSMIRYSTSRGGILVVEIGTIVTLAVWIIRDRKIVPALYRVACIVLAVILMGTSTVYISTASAPVGQQLLQFFSPSNNMPGNPSIDDSQNSTIPGDIIDKIENDFNDRLDQEHADLNSFTSGRVDLWRIYLKEIQLMGHDGNHVVYKENGGIESRSSHWTQLQFGYKYGLLAGVFILLLHIWSGFRSIWFAFKQKDNAYSLFALSAVVFYGLYSVLEANVTTFGRLIILLYFFALTPLVLETKEKAFSPAENRTEGAERIQRRLGE